MPSTTGPDPTAQRPPRRRVAVLSIAVLAVLATVTPFVAVSAVADRGGSGAPGDPPALASASMSGSATGGPASPGLAAAPHENTSGGNLTLFVGPSASYDALDAFGDVATAHRTGAIEREREAIPIGDTLIVAFSSERLGAEYADTVGPNASVRFFQALEGTDVSLTVVSPSGPECETLRLRLNESRHRVLANGTTGEFRLVLDTGALASTGGCRGELDVPGRYEVALERPTEDEGRRTTETFYFEAPEGEPDPVTGGIHVRRGAPAVAGDLQSAADIRRAARSGRLDRTGHVVRGEVAVLDIESSRLMRAYANATVENATTGNTTARLLRAVNATDGRVGFDPQIMSATQGASQPGEPLELRFPGPGIRTIPDRANDTFYVVLDTDRARVRTADDETTLSNSTVDELRPTVVLGGTDRKLYEGRLRVVEPAGSFGIARNASTETDRSLAVVGTDGRFVVRPGTNLAPGSSVTVTVRNGSETLARRVFDTSDGTRRGDRGGTETEAGLVRFDLGPQPPGRALNVTLAHDGTRLQRATVLAGPQPVLRNETARVVRRGPEGVTVRFAVTARYPASGYVVVQNASNRYVGFPVPAGEPVRVEETVTVPRRDGEPPRGVRFIAVYDDNRNGQFDGPRSDGHVDEPFPATDEEGGVLIRSVDLPPPSPTPTVTAPPPGTTIAVDEGQPGFGPLAAVLGLLGLAGLVARRRGRGGSP